MEQKQNKIFLRLAICAVINLLLLGLVNFLGHSLLSGLVVYKNYFSDILAITLAGILISAIWVIAYICLDALKREPLKNILLSFAFAVVLQYFFSAIIKFIATNPYVVLTGLNQRILNFVCNAFPSILTILCVFKFYIFELKEFDENVDSLIYGGIVGCGIGFCDMMTTILAFDSASFDFVLLNFTVRLSIFSSASALAGFLLYYSSCKKSILKTVVSYILIVAVFALSTRIETKFITGIFGQSYTRTLMAFAKTGLFCIGIFAVIVILIFIQLKKNDFKAVENKIVLPDLVILILTFVIAILIRTLPEKNVKFTNQNLANGKNYSFELPYGFESYEQDSLISFFSKEKTEQIKYSNKEINGINVTLEFESEKNYSGTQTDGASYRFVFENLKENIEMKITMNKKDDAYANKIAKTFEKTLEAE